jgi:hypothetical protein
MTGTILVDTNVFTSRLRERSPLAGGRLPCVGCESKPAALSWGGVG